MPRNVAHDGMLRDMERVVGSTRQGGRSGG
jgi:hypothetical protein